MMTPTAHSNAGAASGRHHDWPRSSPPDDGKGEDRVRDSLERLPVEERRVANPDRTRHDTGTSDRNVCMFTPTRRVNLKNDFNDIPAGLEQQPAGDHSSGRHMQKRLHYTGREGPDGVSYAGRITTPNEGFMARE